MATKIVTYYPRVVVQSRSYCFFVVPAVYDFEVAFPKDGEPTLTRMLMGEGGEVHFWIRFVSSRIIVLLELQDKQLFHVDFIAIQNCFCRPFFLTAAKMVSAGFAGDAFPDHIR